MRQLATMTAPKRVTRNKQRRINGYAALFHRDDDPGTEYRMGDVVERISPGAFDVNGRDVLALFNHDPNQLLGRASSGTLKLKVDSTGLRYSIDAETRLGGEILQSIERGDIIGSSFGFTIKDQELERRDGQLVRTIKAVDLFDVGPVSEAAYQSTTAEARGRWDKLNEIITGHRALQAQLEEQFS